MSYGKPCISSTGGPSAGPASNQAISSAPALIVCSASMRVMAVLLLVEDDSTDRFAALHEVEALVDVFQRHRVGDEVVDVDLVFHVPVDDLRDVGAPACTAECRA